MADAPVDITAVIEGWAARRPDALAIRFAGVDRTWAQLVRRVHQLAAGLRTAGIGPGDRVAVLDLNHPAAVELTLACAQIGAACAEVNFRLAPPEIVYVLADSRARLLLHGPEFAPTVGDVRDKLTDVERVIQIGGDADEYETWLDAHEPDPDHHPSAPDDCFVQLYTSGTTGFPKGAMLTHRGMLAHSVNVAADASLGPDDFLQVAMPLFHVGGMAYALVGLTCGGALAMLRTPEPLAVLDMLEHDGITHTFLVPALLAVMTRLPGVGDRTFPALRGVYYGASPMPLPVLRACLTLFPGRMAQVYGMTEASGVVTSLQAGDHDDPAFAHRLVSAGTPIRGVEIEVRDPATGQRVAVDEAGEICVRTEQLMSGYWGNPEATAAAITTDGWLRTGDGGHMDADGYVYVTDRIKDMIISGGENIYPAEIERVLAEHPAVGDCAVIGVPDERWGEVPKAIVVAAPGQTVDADALQAYCREQLAAFKCPKSVDIVDELPRNPTGKILKKDLRAAYWAGRDRQTV
ncbi:MAG: long-chain-fatty-acid--CoA ligase [Pseudonocardiales bacterium]|nr:long-chain-fatty-acid--CoA ligase [Pseudonocardiales bacterium]